MFMSKQVARGFFGFLKTIVVCGMFGYLGWHGINRQAEVSNNNIEAGIEICSRVAESQWKAYYSSFSPCSSAVLEQKPLKPVPDPMMGTGDVEASVLRRLPPVMAEEYPEPTIVMPREEDYYSPSPWPGEPETQQRKSPYVEWLERQQAPPSVMPKPYTPGSTNPARREEFRQRARPPAVPFHPGKVAQLL
jgi:hypothetical protein